MAANKAAVIVCCLLVLCSILAAGNIVRVGNCTEVKPAEIEGKLLSVDVNPCPSQPCVFHKGTNVTATIKFSPNLTVTDGTLQVYGIIAGFKQPFPLGQPDPCKNHGLDCPLKSGVTYSLEIILPIKPLYPAIQLIAEMRFKLPGNNYLFCFLFAIRIAD